MISLDAARPERTPRRIDRSSDRLVAVVSIVIAVTFLIAALVGALLPVNVRRGLWLPLHLALAGGATTAIAGVMPFFSAALAAAPPSDFLLRITSVAAVAAGAVGVTVGITANQPPVAASGGVAFVAGSLLVAAATLRPLRRSLGPRHGVITWGYVAALGNVAVGASIATAYAAGWSPVTERWADLRIGHAWLNLVGFVSLVIVTTLLHFFPTVVGARLGNRRAATTAVRALAVGAPLVALGAAVGNGVIMRLGALAAGIGAASLGLYVWQVARARAAWTTDHAWHAFAIGGLVSAMAWFLVGMAVAVGGVMVHGPSSGALSAAAIAGPLVGGWMAIAVLASASHLLPAVGPGDQAAHARQRRILGTAAHPRLVALNGGVAGISLGLVLGAGWLLAGGLVLLAIGLVMTAGMLARAIGVAVRRP